MTEGERDVIFEQIYDGANDAENCPPAGEKELVKIFQSPVQRAASDKFARTAELRKRIYDHAIASGKLKPTDDLALFLGGTEEQARAAVRRISKNDGGTLGKSVGDDMEKTLVTFRSHLLPEEVEAAAKAIRSLDMPLFLEIIRRAESAA